MSNRAIAVWCAAVAIAGAATGAGVAGVAAAQNSGTVSDPVPTTIEQVVTDVSIPIDHTGDYTWSVPLDATAQSATGFVAQTRVEGTADVTQLAGRNADTANGEEYDITFTVDSFSPGASFHILNIAATHREVGQ